MVARKTSLRLWTTMGVVLGLAAGLAAADTWLQVDQAEAIVQQEPTAASAPTLSVEAADLSGLRVAVHADGLTLHPRQNKEGQSFIELTWPDAQPYGALGTPALPVVRRIFAVPEGAQVSYTVRAGAEATIDAATLGMPLVAWPVQAPVEKLPGALERAVFQMDAQSYADDSGLLAERASVQELGIVRGQHLWQLEIYPVSYNPAKQTVSFCRDITVDIAFDGIAISRGDLRPLPGLRRVVLNPEVLPSVATRAQGNYLIIAASAYQSGIASFATAKTAQGYTVTTHAVAPGTTKETIKAYIQGLYGGAGSPDYVLLVGDTDTIPAWTGGGEGTPDTDIQYVCMDGAADWYPDIPLGRFSCTTATHLSNIIAKTLYFEGGAWADPQYIKRAVFMASEDHYTVSEGTHNYVIENYMVPNDIVCNKLYCHTFGAVPAQTTAAFNDGRFFGIYSGHGAETYWADGPVYYQSDVNALTNANMYAYVCSFACLTGNFTVDECFMETWARAANKGAAVVMGSTIESYWTEDDVLERRLFDTIYDANQPEVAKQIGPVLLETKMRYLAEMGSGATTRRYFEMYNILGDPSLGYPGNCSDVGTIILDSAKYACESTAAIRVLDCGPNTNPDAVDTVTITITSTSEPAGESVLLTETSPNSALFEGSISLSTTNAPGVLWVHAGDTITATYNDADDGSGNPAVVTATAVIDCTPPVISNVHVTDLQARSATVAFNTNEPARGVVHYGLACGSLNQTASGSGYSTTPAVSLSGLQDNTTYFYRVDAADEAGNSASDLNCYTFTTPEIADYFTELFSANDMDNLGLSFTPNGSVDFYRGCVQRPIRPAGRRSR
jgi:hypothetical protein